MKRALAALAALPLLASCGGGDDGAKAKPGATVTITATPSDEASETNVATERAKPLALGKWWKTDKFKVSVLTANQPNSLTAPDGYADVDGAIGATAFLRVCLLESASGSVVASTNDWSMRDGRGAVYDGRVSGNSWPPQPQFSEDGIELLPGDCTEGWIMRSMPIDTKVATVDLNYPDGSTAARWAFK